MIPTAPDENYNLIFLFEIIDGDCMVSERRLCVTGGKIFFSVIDICGISNKKLEKSNSFGTKHKKQFCGFPLLCNSRCDTSSRDD